MLELSLYYIHKNTEGTKFSRESIRVANEFLMSLKADLMWDFICQCMSDAVQGICVC